ncbi:serine/threonine-protein kinase/endoribonuclease IRE1-like [Folsomia candida]|uniref:Serine/threonine-protein kinase ppk4 n=1 Tax=Folsomia candida TaxID=158441 RepID=A0A226CY46_FOLCA|nr:serine/threonine-protein kinase/endoribonuclease IRE1-like [Folsomia candida]XP_035701255.1 serine/threonine-protein kinase/endoribonuclease IRE1-like [Folsomia candida]XP_035701256.1 serine/threonine-protein kinase/endoribonuclease IRE1-like [Folsomia candida]OXA37873.1 Serine/threonine-protein kinase ppk4 [Folsomia candida]
MENVNPKSKPTKTPTLRPPRPSSNNAPELDSPNLLEKAHCSVAKLKKYCVQFELPVPSYSTTQKTGSDKIIRHITTCTVGNTTQTGIATVKADSKKIAAFKVFTLVDQPGSSGQNKPSPSKQSIIKDTVPTSTSKAGQKTSPDPSKITPAKSEKPKSSPTNSKPGSSGGSAPLNKSTPDNTPTPSKPKVSPPATPSNDAIPQPVTNRPLKEVSKKVFYYTDTKIGDGGSSTVYEGYFEVQTRKAAVKICQKSYLNSKKSKELEVLRKLADPNIVTYYIMQDVGKTSYIVMELADCTLTHAIEKQRKGGTTLRKKWASDMTKGLAAMHSMNIVHRDIKPDNVLIFFGKNVAKLADFGISRVLQSMTKGTNTLADGGTRMWRPPEALEVIGTSKEATFKLSPSYDIFALGLTIFYAMSGGRHLFASDKNDGSSKAEANILNYLVVWNLEYESTSLTNLLKAMVNKVPKVRPNAKVVLEHPFFWDSKRGLDFIEAVTIDLKNAEKPMAGSGKSELGFAHDRFCNATKNLEKNWRSRLCPELEAFMTWKAATKSKFSLENKKYGEKSFIKLIDFIRDYDQHNKDWTAEFENGRLKKDGVFGKDGTKYGDYFLSRFPELVTILYTFFQQNKYWGVKLRQFYELNNKEGFEKW